MDDVRQKRARENTQQITIKQQPYLLLYIHSIALTAAQFISPHTGEPSQDGGQTLFSDKQQLLPVLGASSIYLGSFGSDLLGFAFGASEKGVCLLATNMCRHSRRGRRPQRPQTGRTHPNKQRQAARKQRETGISCSPISFAVQVSTAVVVAPSVHLPVAALLPKRIWVLPCA